MAEVESKKPKLIRITEVHSELPKFIQNNQSLFRMAKVVCDAVMKHINLTCLMAKVYSECSKFTLNSQSFPNSPKLIQNCQSLFRVAKVYSE